MFLWFSSTTVSLSHMGAFRKILFPCRNSDLHVDVNDVYKMQTGNYSNFNMT